jgi:RNA polymerase sigma-70 factor (ECF subfamily)
MTGPPPPPSPGPPPGEGEGKPAPKAASKGVRPEDQTEKPLPSAPRPSPLPLPQAPRRAPAPRQPDLAIQERWVRRLQAGEEAALCEVVEAFGERIAAVVTGLLRDRDAVEDVVQETFAKAWFRIGAFRGTSSLYTWLYRVAVNTSKDYMKGRRRRPAGALDDLAAGHLPATGAPPLEGLERREARLRVRAAIESLPRHYRSVLALREIEGMPYHEIAEVLGLSLGTVESRLFRARRRLKAALERTGEGRRGRPGGGGGRGIQP